MKNFNFDKTFFEDSFSSARMKPYYDRYPGEEKKAIRQLALLLWTWGCPPVRSGHLAMSVLPPPRGYGDYFAWGEVEPYYSSLSPLTWKSGKEAIHNNTAGEYWSSTDKAATGNLAYKAYFKYENNTLTVGNGVEGYRSLGRNVRAVRAQ